jgi:uncharacterized caspase-like protein
MSGPSKNSALVVGVSQYPNPAWNLPAVASDVREIANLLGSKNGSFDKDRVQVLTDAEATKSGIMSALDDLFRTASPQDTVFFYLAGHGLTNKAEGTFFFVPHDIDPYQIAATAVSLVEIREAFQSSASQRAFMWLDFCHSGGIIDRAATSTEQDNKIIERTLEVVHGRGKLIYAACSPEQTASESPILGHGLFTAALLDGLRGAASVNGEVTVNSLFDYIDRTMGSDKQRPMQFGHMAGRIVLTHSTDAAHSRPASLSPSGHGTVVKSSGAWVFLGTGFFETKQVQENTDGSITVELITENAEDEAAIRRLKPDKYGRSEPIPFAYGNTGMQAQVRDVQSVTAGDHRLWTITLSPEDLEYGGGMMEVTYQTDSRTYSPADFARMRAGRLLLNVPPPLSDAEFESRDPINRIEDAMLESNISGSGTPASVSKCVIHVAHKSFGNDPHFCLVVARLLAIYFIRAAWIAEEILELNLGPIADGKVHVRFRGRRRRRAMNVEPELIELEGDCVLPQ